MANFQSRVVLFNNDSDNPNAPVLTGKLEIPVEQIDALLEELAEQPESSYGTRRYKVIDLSCWQSDGSSNLAFSGKARSPQQKRPQAAKASQPAPVQGPSEAPAHVETIDELMDALEAKGL